MATTFFLVRHAAHDRVGSVLCGRMPAVNLGELGRRQADALADRLGGERISAIYTSPLERARETAAPIAQRIGLHPQASDPITEIDFGRWTGRSFDSLGSDPDWTRWNESRSTARPPGGESMGEVQSRVTGELSRLQQDHPEGRIVLVSHCDVIKAALASHLRLSLNDLGRFEIAPASVSILVAWGSEGKVLGMNEAVAS
ncbi:histidine phosphatase family protein [Roseomonas xinghualingensis]|uniref:histidine phosphatase family protein n=1 Tax=Roseomonas xinghualingensis TaxID=2986475 RepID=UPI0021F0AA49|nr:histidine phosphatase family protein [Roseomonas sp. SXEYE001]MCV4208561.1 histidine phosphatase family protein [Roseomonas sp. SXEYE001]